MKQSILTKRLLVCCVTLATSTIAANAGNLSPPAGAVLPTLKTLSEVEPRIAINATNTPGDADSVFKITQRGSYYLTGNIQGVAAKHGVEITVSGVTLNLSGFDLLGIAGSLDGVSVTVSSLTNITVLNGSVRDWEVNGVDMGGSTNCRVADIHASGNNNVGIVAGFGSSVTNCNSQGNGTGIFSGVNCTISNCASHDSTTGSGFEVGAGTVVSNCSAYSNTQDGIRTGDGCAVTNSSAYNNTLDGINTNIGCTVTSCTMYNNTGDGISTGSGNTILSCTVNSNDQHGINTSTGSMVADCAVRLNTLDGIRCSSSSLIHGNNCSSNGNSASDGANIHATGSDNRIEGNACIGADRGIDVDASGNFITRNTSSGATVNWDIAATNKCLVVLGVNAAAISGDSGGTGVGSTDPNANFTY